MILLILTEPVIFEVAVSVDSQAGGVPIVGASLAPETFLKRANDQYSIFSYHFHYKFDGLLLTGHYVTCC